MERKIIPNSLCQFYALEDYDISNPDFEKFPALDGVEGIECFLEHGDTLLCQLVGGIG